MNSRILSVLALILALGVFFLYVRPAWTGSIAETKIAIQDDVDALSAAAEYTHRESELANAKNAIDPANLDRLTTLLPDSVDNVTLILDINALAARSGILLSNIDVAQGKDAPTKKVSAGPMGNASGAPSVSPVGSVDLTLTAVGSYAALQTFLAGIEKSARLLDLHDIVVTSSETGVYSYKMEMRLYWLR